MKKILNINELLLTELLKSKKLTKQKFKYFKYLVNLHSENLSYKNKENKEFCKDIALNHLLNNWDKFYNAINNNPFAYYTNIILNGFANGYKLLNN